MTDKIYLSRIEIKDLGGIAYFSTDLNRGCNFVIGANGAGKTTVRKAIELIFSPGNDMALLRAGCEEGWAEVTFTDGYKARKTLYREEGGTVGYKLVVTTPEGGVREAPATFLKRRMPNQAFSVDEFLKLSDEKAVEFLLDLIPLDFTPEEINVALTPPAAKVVMVNRDPRFRQWAEQYSEEFNVSRFRPDKVLDVRGLEELYQRIYAQRTAIIRLRNEVSGAKAVAESGLRNMAGQDWAAERDRLTGQVATIEGEISNFRKDLEQDGEVVRAEKQAETTKANAQLHAEVSERWREITRLQGEITELRNQMLANEQARLAHADRVAARIEEVFREEGQEMRSRLEATKAELAEARLKAEEQAGEEARRKDIASYEEKIAHTAGVETELTRQLLALEKVKMARISEAGIPGLNIYYERKKPKMTVDGIPFAQINQQERVFTAVRFIRKANPECSFVLAESAELDNDNVFTIARQLESEGHQIIMPRWIAGGEDLEVLGTEAYMTKLVESAKALAGGVQ